MRNNPRLSRLVLLALSGFTSALPKRSPGRFVEHLSPPSLSRGKTNRLTLVGTELGGATGLWTSLPSKAVEAALDRIEAGRPSRFRGEGKPRRPAGHLRTPAWQPAAV